MLTFFWIALAFQGCEAPNLTDNDGKCELDEVPASETQQLPADEAAVLATVPTESALRIRWDITPLDVTESDIVVALQRGSAEATVAERGRVGNQECQSGMFLRIPYELSVRIGADDAVASGSAIVQADDQIPPSLEILTPGSMVFEGPRMGVVLSPSWETAVEATIPESWDSWTWQLSMSGPVVAPAADIEARYQEPDADGLKVAWRGQTIAE